MPTVKMTDEHLAAAKAEHPEWFTAADDKFAGKPKPTENCFEDETENGEQRRIDYIRSRGAKAAASLCAQVDRDLAGRKLRRRVG